MLFEADDAGIRQKKTYRNEWKYCCSENDLEMIRNRLDAVLDKDSHSDRDGKYEIHSLYFDDYKDTCAKENDAGISEKIGRAHV